MCNNGIQAASWQWRIAVHFVYEWRLILICALKQLSIVKKIAS